MKQFGNNVKKAALLTLGWLCILIGVAGIFLPFLQGILLLAIGALILSRNSVWFEERISKLKITYPSFGKAMDKMDSWFDRMTKK